MLMPSGSIGLTYISRQGWMTGRGRLALVSKHLETAGFVRNRTSLDGPKSLAHCRLCFWCGPRPEEMQATLPGTRKALGLVLVRRIGLFQAQN